MEGGDLGVSLLYTSVVAVLKPRANGVQGEVGISLEFGKEYIAVLGATAHRYDSSGAEVHGAGIYIAGTQCCVKAVRSAPDIESLLKIAVRGL